MRQLSSTQITNNAKYDTFVDYEQQVRHKTQINSLDVNQHNEPVENGGMSKCSKKNKLLNEGAIA